MGGVDHSVEGFVQEALLKILGNLDSFRGESRFTVWAHKVCVRPAFAEMRRRRWRDVSLEDVIDRQGEGVVAPSNPMTDPEQATAKSMMLADFRRYMDEDLTEKQRVALLAALGGMPLEAIADRTSTCAENAAKSSKRSSQPFAPQEKPEPYRSSLNRTAFDL